MELKIEVGISAPKEDVWKVITDVENYEKVVKGVEKVEILNAPDGTPDGMKGVKWKETRMLFGKTATEVMWVNEAELNSYYNTEAASHGSEYFTKVYVEDAGEGKCTLGMTFTGKPISFSAKIMNLLMGWMFIGVTRKALQQDLEDIKNYVEKLNG